ncbi:MAG: hypothetical protein V9H25_06465 [Candidatus Competibacter sp.]
MSTVDDVVVVDAVPTITVPQLSDEEQAKLIFKEYRLKEQSIGVLKELAERISQYVKEQTDPNAKKLKELSNRMCVLRKTDDVDAYLTAQAERDEFLMSLATERALAAFKNSKTTTTEKVAHQREESDEVVMYAGRGVNRKIEEWLEKDGWVKAERTTTAQKDKRRDLIKQYQANAVKWAK